MSRVYNPEEDKLFAKMFIENAKNFAKYGTPNPTPDQIKKSTSTQTESEILTR